MNRILLLLLVLAVAVQLVFAKLPTSIDKCSRSDAKFDECVLQKANKAMKYLLQGDPELGLPVLRSVTLDPMHLAVTDTVHFNLTNGASTVNDDIAFTAVKFDFEQKSLFVSVKTSRATWQVDYEATGTVQDRPLHEKGQANVTFDGLVVNITVTLDFKTVDGKRYLEATASDATTLSTYDFKPYNKQPVGQQQLSDEQITPLYKQSGLAIRREAKSISDKIALLELNAILKLEPFDEMFLP